MTTASSPAAPAAMRPAPRPVRQIQLRQAGAAGVMAGVVASSAIAPTSVEFDVITAAVSASDSLDAEVVGDV